MKKAEAGSGLLLWQAAARWQRIVKKALDVLDITYPQFLVLSSMSGLAKQQRAVTQVDLSTDTSIDPMTISTIIRTLERKQLVKRQEHSTDTRAKMVTLTANGGKVTRQGAKLVEKTEAQFFNALANKSKAFRTGLSALMKDIEG